MDTTAFDPQSLVTRLEKLERHNRWMERCLVSVTLAGVAVALVAANQEKPAKKTIEGEEIIIRDSAGKKRIFMGVDKTKEAGEPAALVLFDKNEKPIVTLSGKGDGNGGALSIDQKGESRMFFGTGTDRFAGIIMFADPGKQKSGQIGLFYANDGKSALMFNDHNHKTRAAIMLETGGRPILMLQDQNGKSFFSQGQP